VSSIAFVKMGRYNFRPSRVYQTATLAIESQSSSIKAYPPPWYKTIGSIPPGEILTRVPPVGDETQNCRIRKPSKMFMPQQLTYEEDKLRQTFYGDHPWELARPRIIVEQDGKDGQKCDWSRLSQPGRQLNAERYLIFMTLQ
jgi:small subunit ribosomal protein S23